MPLARDAVGGESQDAVGGESGKVVLGGGEMGGAGGQVLEDNGMVQGLQTSGGCVSQLHS